MRYFIFSDVHGDYDAMIDALNQSGYSPSNDNHQIISLGDNFGRAQTGQKSIGVWKYLISPQHKNRPICLRGNHESILLDVLKKGYLSYIDICNGEHKTISSFARCSEGQARFDPEAIEIVRKTGIKEWIESLPWFYETKNWIFTHGWLPSAYPETPLDKILESEWERAVWAHTLDEYEKTKFIHPNGVGKNLAVGHWTSADFWERLGIKSYNIFQDKMRHIWFLDGCTALTHKLNVLIVED